MSSSLESQSGEGPGARQAMILEGNTSGGPRTRNLTNLADMVCSVRMPFADATESSNVSSSLPPKQSSKQSMLRDEAGQDDVDDYGDDELTDEDSENLLSDEDEDDGESGFLSQM